jgi:IclR family transcriptional regulator, KDG regulon repressor
VSERYRIRAVGRMVAVLDAFSAQTPELGVADLAERLGLPKSTVHRFLVNLEAGGLLERVPRTGRYRLGLRLLELGGVVVSQMSLLEEAPPILRELGAAAGEAAFLAVLEDGAAVYLEARSSGPMVPVGDRRPAVRSALGKALLAWRAPEDLGEAASERLAAELAGVRSRGFAVHDGELGVRGLAAPVRDHTGLVAAALGVEGPAARLTPGWTISLASALMDAARTLSRRLGAHRAQDLGPRPRRVITSRPAYGAARLSGAGAHPGSARAAARSG